MKNRIHPIFVSLIIIGSSAIAQAATFNWNGLATGGATGVSETWDTVTANWTGDGTVWPTTGSDNDAAFGGTAGNISLSGPVVANDLTFTTAGYKIQGQTLFLAGTTPTITNGVTAEISAIMGGSVGLTKRNSGTLILSGSNFPLGGSVTAGIAVNTDPTTAVPAQPAVNDGILRFSDNRAAGTGTLVINGGYQRGRVELTGGITLNNAITLQGRQESTYPAVTNFAGDNTLSGTINVAANGARLIFNAAAGKLTVSGSAMTGSNTRTLTFRGAGSGVFAKNITTAVVSVVEKIDVGTWVIPGASTYTGATTVGGGTLVVTGSSGLGTGATANVSVSSGATLNYAAKSDSPLAIGGTLTVTGGANSAIGCSIGSSTTSASINVAGTATITNAAHNVNLFGIAGVTPVAGTYTLISGGGSSVLNPTTLPTLGRVYNNSNFTVGSLSRTATTLTAAITPASPLTIAYWVGGLAGSSNIWSVSNGSTASNWLATDGGAAQALVPGAGTAVVISTSSPTTAPTATVLGNDMTIERLTIADTSNGLGLNADAFSLTISPTDSAVGITMAASVPASTIASAVVLGQPQTWTNLSTNPLTVSGSISGANDLIKKGSGTLVLSGNNTYTGVTRSQEGSLEIASVNALATTTLDMNALDTGTVTFAAPGTSNYSVAAITGSRALSANGNMLNIGASNLNGQFSGVLSNASVTKVGTGTLTISGNNTFTGNINHFLGRISLTHSNALGAGPKNFYMQGTNRSLFLSNDITIPSNITITASSNSFDGGGINNESGSNTILGQINFDSGNPALNISSADGTLTVLGAITLVTTGRPLHLGGASLADNTIIGAISENTSAVLPVVKQGAGKWILAGTNTYKGDTDVRTGTLVLANGGSQKFYPKSDGSSNKITDTNPVASEPSPVEGIVILNGAFDIDLSAASSAPDGTSWLLVEVSTLGETFDTNFTVTGFTESPAGTWKKTVGASVYTFTEIDGSLVKTAAPTNTYANWLTANPPATGFSTDSDNDGVANGLENVLGTNPNSYTAGLTDVSSTSSTATYKHTLNPTIASDVSYVYDWSTDLVEWKASTQTNTGGTTATITPSAPAAGVVTVTTAVTAGPSAKVFTRIKATQP